MSRLFVCEKRQQAEFYQRYCNEGDSFILCTTITSYLFDYPSSLKFKDLPIIDSAIKYKVTENPYVEDYSRNQYTSYYSYIKKRVCNPILVEFYNYKSISSKNSIHNFLSSFDEIVYACDADHTGARGFDFLFEKYFEIDDLKSFSLENNVEINAFINLGGFDENSIREAYSNIDNFFTNEYIGRFRESYLKKDFFEYNYNINSLLLINKAYYLAFGTYPKYILTKNLVQTLFLLKKLSVRDVYFSKYLEHNNIGSPASRTRIIGNLKEMNLVSSIKIDNTIYYCINDKGYKFLSLLHRKINDPYLSKRVVKDCENKDLSFIDFKEKYSKYLKDVFSKQKRFINKMS